MEQDQVLAELAQGDAPMAELVLNPVLAVGEGLDPLLITRAQGASALVPGVRVLPWHHL